MNAKRSCIVLSVVFLIGIAFLLLAGLGYRLWSRQIERKRENLSIPKVLIISPSPGSTLAEGSFVDVSAMVISESPIANVELWVDNQLSDSLQSLISQGGIVSTVRFNFLLTEGVHSLTVRVFNQTGVVGQSLPLSLIGVPKPAVGEVIQNIPIHEGETLDEIAAATGNDPAILQQINPQWGGNPPPAGTVIKVPLAAEREETPSQPAAEIKPPGSLPMVEPNTPMLTELHPSYLPIDLGAFVPIKLPTPPAGLEGEVSQCDVTLKWLDNSDNETRYEVWTAWMGITPQLVAELTPAQGKGTAWYRFRSPQTGWVPFWVEAANQEGKQPTNTIILYVDPQKCEWSQGSGSFLMVQVFDMTLHSPADSVYCYVSYEDAPERRIPDDINQFIAVKNGKAGFGGLEVGAMVSAVNAILIPLPPDGKFDTGGKCLGWSGNQLIELGSFSGSFPMMEWDGARRIIKTAAYDIEFSMKPWTPAVEAAMHGKYWYENPTIPAPWGLKASQLYSPITNVDPRERLLSWNWDGDPASITGFQVYLEGKPYGFFSGAGLRSASVLNPYYCGSPVKWQVVAVSASAQSPLSQEIVVNLPNCQSFVQVIFQDVMFQELRDGFKPWAQFNECDSVDLYYTFYLNDQHKSFGWSPSFGEGCVNCVQTVGCNVMSFQQLGSFYSVPYPDTLVSAIDDKNIKIQVMVNFWDYDWGSDDDLISKHYEEFNFASLEQAQAELGCGKEYFSSQKVHESGYSIIHFKLMVYPNPCSDFPVGVPLPEHP